jgi:RNA polymerase sigma-70 factor, ECF subfamily
MNTREPPILLHTATTVQRDIDDVLLVAHLVASQAAAWQHFRARFDRLIYRSICKVTGRFARVINDEDIAEVYANVYLLLVSNNMQKLRSWSPALGSSLPTWIGMIAIHATYDYLRSLKREPRKEDIAKAARIASPLPDPFEVATCRERAAITSESLASFSERDRTFATLYFSEELSPEEIARTLQISVKTVYSKRHKLQARLQLVLRKSFPSPDDYAA